MPRIVSTNFLKNCQILPDSQDQWQITIFILEFKSTHLRCVDFDWIRVGSIYLHSKLVWHNVEGYACFLALILLPVSMLHSLTLRSSEPLRTLSDWQSNARTLETWPWSSFDSINDFVSSSVMFTTPTDMSSDPDKSFPSWKIIVWIAPVRSQVHDGITKLKCSFW